MPRNVIEYVFEGNMLNLEQAIARVESLLRRSVKAMKTYQDGTLNAEQEARVKSTRALLRQLRAQKKLGREATEEEARRANVAGKQALKSAASLYRESLRVTKQGLAKQQAATKASEEKTTNLVKTSSQEQAHLRALYLSKYSDQMRSLLTQEGYTEVQRAVADFRAAQAAFKEGKINQQELASATENLNNVYKQYGSVLREARYTQQAFSHSIQDAKTLTAALQEQALLYVQSLYFWLNIIRRVIRVLKEGIEKYADYVESLNFLQRAAGEASEAMVKFADAQVRAFGLDPEDVNTAAAIFYSFADSMGLASEEATLMSKNMTQLAQDIASLQNIDVETAAVKLRSALAGQSRALATLGVNVNDANVEEWLYTKGLQKSMKQMNETSQAAARYAFILEKTSSAHGDLSKTLQSPANQLKVLRAQVGLLGQNVGTIATTIFLPFVKLLNQMLLPINAFVKALTSLSAGGFSSSIGDAAEDVDGLTDSLEDADKAARGLTGIDEINQFDAETSGAVQLGLDADISALLTGYDNLAGEASALVPLFESLGYAMAPIWDMLGNETNFSLLTGILKGLATILWPVQKLLEGIGWLINLLPEPIRNIVGLLTEAIIALTTLALALSLVKTLMASKVFTLFAGIFKGIAVAIWSAVKAAVAWIAKVVVMIAKSIAMSIRNIIEAKSWWGKALAIVAAAGLGAVVVAGVIGAGVAIVSAAQASSTPKLATGGVTTGPTFAMIGEGEYNEAVVPLGNSPQFKEMKRDIASEVSRRGSGNSPTSVILQINGKEMARALLPDIKSAQAQTGVKLR